MKIKGLLFLIFMFSLTCASASEKMPDELYEDANKAYANSEFQLAIEKYMQIINQGYEQDNLFFNLANAFYKTEETTLAVLYYEKALKLNPAHADARFNLKMTNQKTVDKIEPLPELSLISWWKNIIYAKSADDWGWLTIQALFLGLLLFSGYIIINNVLLKKVGFFGGVAMLIASGLFFLFGYQQISNVKNNSYAIVFSPTLTVRSAPDITGTKLFVIHEGVKVQVLDSLSEWRKISIPNGSEGWVKTKAIEKI
ncbi:MAG: SH3 domain-containing protein [Bacteroidota bacterium]|nr:SH3 domain-containing protein [Bacteroidota bacterium]